VIVTTTPSIDGRRVAAYHGVVVGERVLGADGMRDLLAGATDIFGGRSNARESELGKARAAALAEMEEHAMGLGADAVVGVDLDYEVIGSTLMVSASGTAVTTEAAS
jgi:uncharacterized protein YbjQ (UPF0145 family)